MDLNLKYLTPRQKEKFLLDLAVKEEPNTLIEGGFNLLTWACWESLQRVIRILLTDHKADPNIRNTDGTTALTWAPCAETTKLLLQYGASVPFEEPNDREYSLHYSARAGRRDQLQLLLMEGDGFNYLESFNEFGETPLSIAANRGHLDVVEYLLRIGANPNAFDENKSTDLDIHC